MPPRNMHRKTKACKDKTGVERPWTRNKKEETRKEKWKELAREEKPQVKK